jgi:probable rRNA maturation factor
VAASRRPGSPRVLPPVAERLARVAARVLRWERPRDARTHVELTVLDAAAMRRLNRRVTGRRGLTDVIAFTLPQPDGRVLGDVYVCPDAARRYIAQVNGGRPTLADELVRLTVHGTLHVLGYDHPTGPGRTRSAMWRRQERYVRRLLQHG